MPSSIVLRLAAPPSISEVAPPHLHGAACAIFDGHKGAARSFSVTRPRPVGSAGSAVWQLNLLDDRDPPAIPTGVRFGSSTFAVTDFRVDRCPFGALLAHSPADTVDVQFLTPTYFTRSARDYPLPDPIVFIDSLKRHWESTPTAPGLDDQAFKAVKDHILIDGHDIGTRQAPGPHGTRKIGFVGHVRFALPPRACQGPGGQRTARLLGVLLAFARYSGLGALTSYGFGAVRVDTRHG